MGERRSAAHATRSVAHLSVAMSAMLRIAMRRGAALSQLRATKAATSPVADTPARPSAPRCPHQPRRVTTGAEVSAMSQAKVLSPQQLSDLWAEHLKGEFQDKDVEATLATMVDDAYVNHMPVNTGGRGKAELRRFYRDDFI